MNILTVDTTKRIYGLDILRAVAILFVVAGHSTAFLPYTVKKVSMYFIFDGVSIFFVLSGFLIGTILIKHLEDEKSFIDFWWRRWRRTLPNYFFVLFLLSHLTYNSFWKADEDYFFFIQNLEKPHPDFFPEAWSLSIEEWFYIITPVTIMLINFFFRPSIKTSFITTAILLMVFSFSFRVFRYLHTDINNVVEWDLFFRKQVITRLDALAFGLVGAWICFYYKEMWTKYKKKLFIWGIIVFLVSQILLKFNDASLYFCIFSFTVTAISTLAVLPFLSELKTGKGFLFVCLTYISLISYSMYLLNYSLIQFFVMPHVPLPFTGYQLNAAQFATFWLLTLFCSTITFLLIEQPFMRVSFRRRLKY